MHIYQVFQQVLNGISAQLSIQNLLGHLVVVYAAGGLLLQSFPTFSWARNISIESYQITLFTQP